MEQEGKQHKPKYFTEYVHKPAIPENKGQEHKEFRYNSLYFEKDRLERDWSRLPNIFGPE
jgi:hypothetical protein